MCCDPVDAVVACALYGGVFVLISIAYNLLWYAAAKDRVLLRSGVPKQVIRKFTRNYRLGFPLYLLVEFRRSPDRLQTPCKQLPLEEG